MTVILALSVRKWLQKLGMHIVLLFGQQIHILLLKCKTKLVHSAYFTHFLKVSK